METIRFNQEFREKFLDRLVKYPDCSFDYMGEPFVYSKGRFYASNQSSQDININKGYDRKEILIFMKKYDDAITIPRHMLNYILEQLEEYEEKIRLGHSGNDNFNNAFEKLDEISSWE
jgi:hypothetical protein